ncbi:MAG: hypothetical protein R3C19_02265 [Planctomycetaceae bacterium]
MTETATETKIEKPLFSDVEIEQFDADDVVAGSAIGKMLSLLFLYTVLAMSLVAWWTFRTVDARSVAESPSDAAAHGDTGH